MVKKQKTQNPAQIVINKGKKELNVANILRKRRPAYTKKDNVDKQTLFLRKKYQKQGIKFGKVSKTRLQKLNSLLAKYDAETVKRKNETAAIAAFEIMILALDSRAESHLEQGVKKGNLVNVVFAESDVITYLDRIRNLKNKESITQKQYDILTRMFDISRGKHNILEEINKILAEKGAKIKKG